MDIQQIDLSTLTIEQLQDLMVACEAEIESRKEDELDLDEIEDDCIDVDDLSEEEQADFDKEFWKQYPMSEEVKEALKWFDNQRKSYELVANCDQQ